MEIKRDNDPAETAEWREALASVLAFEGPDRGSFLLGELMAEAQRTGIVVPFSATTPYLNTIRPEQQTPHPGDRIIEHRIKPVRLLWTGPRPRSADRSASPQERSEPRK